ncbi:hypothetical protein LTR85_000522 [Meristemomyces frigidus]|nr:hypothetical protein LTR85_000522 [Meristemomyces frigidus]
MATNTPGMLRLPVELQKEVVENITSKADLKSLCRTCKELQSVATPQLYQSVVLRTSQLKTTLKKAFRANNPGLSHVRSLRVTEQHGEEYQHKFHGLVLCHVLQVLPKSGLKLFEIDTRQAVSLDILFLLRTRQHCLRNCQLQRLLSPSKASIIPDKADLGLITCIQLCLRTRPDCERAGQLLRHATSVQRLDICAAASVDFGNELSAVYTPQPQHLTLRAFVLEVADGGYLVSLLTSVVDLVLVDCDDASTLLDMHTSHLRTIAVVRADDAGSSPHAMADVLDRFVGLEALQVSHVTRSSHCGFEWASLARHGRSLRLLYLDDFAGTETFFSDGEYDRSPKALEKSCKSCGKLEQLAISMPSWRRENWLAAHGLFRFLKCVKHLKVLKSLRLFALVDGREDNAKVRPSSTILRTQNIARRADMQDLADTIFKELSDACPHLTGLVIDARREGQDCSSQTVERFGFVRARLTDICGGTRTIGVPIEPHMIKHHEPCSEIFEDDFGAV